MAGGTFGDRLRELRKERGMQQRELGDLYNLSSSAIGSYERNLREPTLELLLQLSEYFGVSVDYLLCRTDERLTAKEYKEKDSYELSWSAMRTSAASATWRRACSGPASPRRKRRTEETKARRFPKRERLAFVSIGIRPFPAPGPRRRGCRRCSPGPRRSG